MGRTGHGGPRAAMGIKGERHAADVAEKLGKALPEGRRARRMLQSQAAELAGLSQSTWSQLENDRDPRFTLATWDRAAHAVGATLDAFLRGATPADLPRDHIHLGIQELIIRIARPGSWSSLPEEQIDREARTSRYADVLLCRRRPGARDIVPAEYGLFEVTDWFADVGDPMRDWNRQLDALERYAIARMVGDDCVPITSGCWVVRATQRNRSLIADHRNIFRARFPGSGAPWLSALGNSTIPMPNEAALLWVAVDGTRLFAARLGGN